MDHTRSRTPGRASGRTTDRRLAGRAGPGRGATAAGIVPPQRRDTRRPGGGPGGATAASLRRRELERQPRYWFANRLLLTLSGQKPVHWMLGHTLGAAYDQLVRLAPLAPLRPTARAGGPAPAAPVVGRCDEYRPDPRVIEAFARIVSGDRVQALAFRLEQCRDERWRCSAVELGGIT
ncbi:Rv3235 family protein [Streptomyces sp. KR80]|uniref:Rv3235 family protein n=1 Tax=Streptomyces sp. KR80 TaxID=3457426 RepID=UPI003FD31743